MPSLNFCCVHCILSKALFRGSSCNISLVRFFHHLFSTVGPLWAPLTALSYPDPDDCVPCVAQEWHDGWWPTSSGTYHLLGSVFSAVGSAIWLDDSPHIGTPVLWQFPLQPLP
jgi:hypothetical protein